MAGLEMATSMYEESTRSDAQLRDQHWIQLWKALSEAIKNREPYLLYSVPTYIVGPYPPQNQDDIVQYLLKELRDQRFTVTIPDVARSVIRVSGWAEKARSKREQDAEFKRHYSVIPEDVRTADEVDEILRVPRAKPRAKLGELSSRLAALNQKKKKNQS